MYSLTFFITILASTFLPPGHSHSLGTCSLLFLLSQNGQVLKSAVCPLLQVQVGFLSFPQGFLAWLINPSVTVWNILPTSHFWPLSHLHCMSLNPFGHWTPWIGTMFVSLLQEHCGISPAPHGFWLLCINLRHAPSGTPTDRLTSRRMFISLNMVIQKQASLVEVNQAII